VPTYLYDCMPCAKRHEKQRSMSEADPGYTCDDCNSNLVRVYTPVGSAFNGSGFYVTDNRKK
jgi:putative FmdB family regulatory protein